MCQYIPPIRVYVLKIDHGPLTPPKKILPPEPANFYEISRILTIKSILKASQARPHTCVVVHNGHLYIMQQYVEVLTV